MDSVPSNMPGSQSTKLTHDFCHLDSKGSDEVYTNFSFREVGGRMIRPFQAPDNEQDQMWIWISPRGFAIVSNIAQMKK